MYSLSLIFCKPFTDVIMLIMGLSGRIGKVVASHAAVARSSPAEVAVIYTLHVALSEYCP